MASVPSVIDRAEIHKSCKSLENVASILVTYTETLNSLVSINKKLAKALRETAGVKGTNGITANALSTSACIFEALHEVDNKFVKIADKEVDALADDIKKWFKKLAKEEKAHDERLTNASAKLKQAGQSYEKKSKRKDADLSEEHSRYLAVLNTVGPEMTLDKQNHAAFVTHRHTTLIFQIAASVSRLAETEWGRACEHVRKFAPFVGGIGECRALCEGGWNGSLPADLPDETSTCDKGTTPNNESLKAAQTVPSEQLSSPSIPSASLLSTPMNVEPAQSPIRSRSNTLEVNNSAPKRELSRSPRSTSFSAPEYEDFKPLFSEASTLVKETPANTPAGRQPSSPMGHTSGTITEEPEQFEHLSEQESTREPSSESNYKEQSRAPNPFETSPTSSSNTGAQNFRVTPSLVPRSTPASEEAASKPSRPLPLPSPTAIHHIDVERITQSTDSLSSKVAAMRDRYDSRMTLGQNSSRNLPRSSQKVAELATRYTSAPLDIDNNSISSPTGLTHNDHFPTFQERFGRGHKFKAVNTLSPESVTRQRLDQEPLAKQEHEVLRYSGVTVQDRDRGYGYTSRAFEERLPMPRAELAYYDEMGVRTPGGLPSGTTNSQGLLAREVLLLERERQLEIEREILISARESAVSNAIPPYGRRYSDSPRMFKSNQTTRQRPEMQAPENHPSNCKCPRCSQSYAFDATRSPQAGPNSRPISSNQAPLSSLRPPIDDKRWRRLSTGPSAFDRPERDLGMSIGNISSPNISLPTEDFSGDGRRRSLDVRNSRDFYDKDDY